MIDRRDVRIDMHSAGMHNRLMRLVHLPTGVTVESTDLEVSRHELFEQLKAAVNKRAEK